MFQFETGLFYRNSNNESILAKPTTVGGELFFRYGKFLEKLEFDAKIAYQNDEIKNPFGTNYHIYGISELTLGAKYLVYQQEFTDKSKEIRSWKRRMAFDKNRLIPSVGVFAGVHTNFLGKDYKDDGISFKGAVLLQNDFSDIGSPNIGLSFLYSFAIRVYIGLPSPKLTRPYVAPIFCNINLILFSECPVSLTQSLSFLI